MQNKFGFGINGTYYVFDLIESLQIQSQSELSEYPLVNKIMVADHKFDKPRTISVSGKISPQTNGHRLPIFNGKSIQYINNLTVDRKFISKPLNKLYEFFMNLKTSTQMFTLFTPSIMIKNCVITDFSWSEGEVVDVSFSLNEVRTFTISEELTTQKIMPDPSLPELTDPIPQSAVETLLLTDTTQTDKLIYEALKSKELIADDWVERLTNLGKTVGFAAIAGAIAGVVIAGVVIKAAILSTGVAIAGISTLVALATNPIGWLVIAAAAVTAIIGAVVFWFWKQLKLWKRRREFINEFKTYKNNDKQIKEAQRYSGMVSKIYEGIKKLDQHISSYSVSSNIPQELLITINSENYLIEFTRDSQESNWNFEVKDLAGKVLKNKTMISPEKTIYSCTDSNMVMRLGPTKLYFVYDIQWMGENGGNVRPTDLSKINLVVTTYSMDKLKEVIGDIAIQNMRRKAGDN